jgi:hypothetical protein
LALPPLFTPDDLYLSPWNIIWATARNRHCYNSFSFRHI